MSTDNRPKELAKATDRLLAAKRLSDDDVYDTLCWNRDQLLIQMRRLIAAGQYKDARPIKALLNHAMHAVDRYEEKHGLLQKSADKSRTDDDTIGYEIPLPVPSKKNEPSS